MLAKELFHPHHVVPRSELIAALIKSSDHAVAEVLVIFGAVVGKMLVWRIRPAYAGLKIYYALGAGDALKRRVQHFSDADVAAVKAQIYRRLRRPVVGRAADKGAQIGIAQKLAVLFRDDVRIPRQLVHHAACKLVKTRNGGLEAYGRFLDIWRVERQKLGGIRNTRNAQLNIVHSLPLLP